MTIKYKHDHLGGTFHITSRSTQITVAISARKLKAKSIELFKVALEFYGSSTSYDKTTVELISELTEKAFSESVRKELYGHLKEQYEPEA